MLRFFNTTGPCDPQDHYLLPAERRMPDLLPYVQQKLYFVVHAARQTGKTTAMRSFAERLRGLGTVAVWATLEESQGMTLVTEAEPIWLRAIYRGAEQCLAEAQRPPALDRWLSQEPGTRLSGWLGAWAARVAPAPLVLLLDEADTVSGHALVSLLRQLRAGFMNRGPGRFPVSVGLIGMRDLRDYLTQAKDGVPVNPGSPFNVKVASITLRNFNRDEIAELVQQHTDDTEQRFEPDAVDRVWYWTAGQPFLVNALARICVMELCSDRAQPVGAQTIDVAKERLILSRTTHLDALSERLREARVARIVQAVLLGDQTIPYDHDDFQYTVDLGLVRKGPDGAEISCALYREVLARQLSYNVQENLPRPRWRWRRADGGLDMEALVGAFLQWWRENAAIVETHAAQGYIEAVAQIAFMGFLQKVINGGGTITREYAAGRGAIDLLVEFAGERHTVELKRVPPAHVGPERVRREGIEQLLSYLDSLGEREGWLLIFDQRAGRSWEERLWSEEIEVEGRVLHLRGA